MLNSSLTSVAKLPNNFEGTKKAASVLAKKWNIKTPNFEERRAKRIIDV